MINLFSDEIRRNPYPAYDHIRSASPVLRVPPPFDAWMIFDYDGVKRALNDHDCFSSRVPAPRNWFLFFDPPAHTKLRGLIAKAFSPGVVARLEPRIRQLSGELLDACTARAEIDLAAEYSVPLPMKVISEMIGVPPSDWPRFKKWSDCILKISYARSGEGEAETARKEFSAVTLEMDSYLAEMIAQRRRQPKDDLLTRLMDAQVDGERLTQDDILGFFQMLIVGGQETTTNLINNAVLCFIEHPDQLARLRAGMRLLTTAIEEVLRYRSPVQWMMRTPTRGIEMHGQTIPRGALVLPMIGSANRDPRQFADPARFDIAREPNPHIAFGHGIHFCIGAALSRLEARIALTPLLERMQHFELATAQPWEPRKALHVHGPSSLPIRFETRKHLGAG